MTTPHQPQPQPHTDGWQDIATADLDADEMLLGIVRKGILEEVHIGGFRWAMNEDEVSCWWSDQCDDEIVPTHWAMIPPLPKPPSTTQSKIGEIE